MPEPELVADWSETLGPAAWDVYACGVPYPWFFNQVAGAVRAGRPIRPGEGPLAEITTAEQLARDLQAAKDALALAERIGHPRLVTESRVILAYLEILSTLPEITALLAKVRATEALSAEEQSRLEELAGRVEKAGQTLEKSLWEWARVVNPDVDKNPPSRFVDTVRVCRQTADAIAEAAKPPEHAENLLMKYRPWHGQANLDDSWPRHSGRLQAQIGLSLPHGLTEGKRRITLGVARAGK